MDYVEGWFNSLGNRTNLDKICDSLRKDPSLCVYIGTDSHVHNNCTYFAIAICILRKGKGGNFFIKKFQENLDYQQEMSYRLLKEVSNSIDIALMLRKKIPNKQITIHIDVNENQKHKSSTHTKRLVSFVKAMGFVCETKPNSWASFSVADKFTK